MNNIPIAVDVSHITGQPVCYHINYTETTTMLDLIDEACRRAGISSKHVTLVFAGRSVSLSYPLFGTVAGYIKLFNRDIEKLFLVRYDID